MITLSLVKAHLRVLHNREDVLIQSYIDAALIQFEHYTGRKLYADQASLDADTAAPDDTQVIDPAIQSGALVLIGYLYNTRDMDATMPQATQSLWQPYRIIRVA